MLEVEQIEKKMYEQPQMFAHYYRRKEWQKAHFLREDMAQIALFLEFSEKKMDELFGSRQDLDNVVVGFFPEDACIRAYDWCILHNAAYDSITFDDIYRLLWAKKEAPGRGLLGA